MITTTEDQFDVDYDIFSLAGRAAFVGGGIYALEESLRQDIFKGAPNNLGKYNNEYVKSLSGLLAKDPEYKKKQNIENPSDFKKSVFFRNELKQEKKIVVNDLNTKLLNPKQGQQAPFKDFFSGGYKGASEDVFQALERAQNQIRMFDEAHDGVSKASKSIPKNGIQLKFDKKNNLIGLTLNSKAGAFNVPLVQEDGSVDIRGSRYSSRSLYKKSQNEKGYAKSKHYGVDVGVLKHIEEDYSKYLSGELKMSDLQAKIKEALVYDSKTKGQGLSVRTNPAVKKGIAESAMPDVFTYTPYPQMLEIAKNESVYGQGGGNASRVTQGIVYLSDNPARDIIGLRYTNSPDQLFRSNVSYTKAGSAGGFIERMNTLFMDKKQLKVFSEVAKEMGFGFGELAEEELIANKSFLGETIDTTRSIEVNLNKSSDLTEYMLEEARKASGLSVEKFSEEIENFGLERLPDDVKQKISKINTNDYRNFLRQELQKSKLRSRNLIKANSVSDELLIERRQLIKEKEILTNIKRGKDPFNYNFKNEKEARKALRNEALYRSSENIRRLDVTTKEGNVQNRIDRINNRLNEIKKKVSYKDLKNSEFQKARKELSSLGKTKTKAIIGKEQKRITDLVTKSSNQSTFGKGADGRASVKKTKDYNNLFVNSISVQDNQGNKVVNIGFRKQEQIKQGTKIVDGAGEIKSVVKEISARFEEALIETARRMGETITPELKAEFSKVAFIANAKSMKNELTARAAYSVIDSIEQKAIKEGNSKVLSLYKGFRESSQTDDEFKGFVQRISDMAPGQNLNKLIGDDTSVGFIKSKMFSFGQSASELGAGRLGFFAERHINMMTGLGLKNFAESVLKRRITTGIKKTVNDIDEAQKIMMESGRAGFIDFKKLNSPDFMENVFPSMVGKDSIFESRSKFLKPFMQGDSGVAYIDLGEEVLGYKRIAIFGEERFKGYAGESIGFSGQDNKFTRLDESIKEIVQEIKKPRRDKGKLETLIKNYEENIKQMRGSVANKIFKDKFTGSMAAQLSSGSDALRTYADDLGKLHGFDNVKHQLPFVGAVSQKKFIDLFGRDAYEDYKKTKVSKSWAFGVREPVEGLSGVPMNIVPANLIDGIENLNDERIALVSGSKNNILKMVFGDFDGDMMTIGAAVDEKSALELKRLALSNDEVSVGYRKAQEYKTMFSLKGKKAGSMLEHTMAELRLSTHMAKNLEKGFVGTASNRLAVLHEVNSRLYANTAQYSKNSTMLHVLMENIIKGKHQSSEDLLGDRAKKILDSITDGEIFNGKNLDERVNTFRGFFDELILGEAAVHADRLRSGDKSEEFRQIIVNTLAGKEDAKNYKQLHKEAMDRAAELLDTNVLDELTGDQNMKVLMGLSGYGDLGSGVEDALDLDVKSSVLSESKMRLLAQAESIQEKMLSTKKSLSGFGGNLFKYAALPAAGFGLLGTVFGARSSINSEVELSDSMAGHEKSNSGRFKPLDSANIKRPKHMKPEVMGKAGSGFKIDKYSASHKVSEMRINDNTSSFDYFDMKDKMNRGY